MKSHKQLHVHTTRLILDYIWNKIVLTDLKSDLVYHIQNSMPPDDGAHLIDSLESELKT